MNPLLIARAKRHGIANPIIAWRASKKAGIPYWVACAFLVQETSGGHNVWGSDSTWMRGVDLDDVGLRTVTEDTYKVYLVHRDRFGKQGVGPMQLTAASLQDEADAAGGCWKPYPNMLTAFDWLGELRATEGNWHDAARRYNGSEAYAVQMDARFDEWRQILKVRD